MFADFFNDNPNTETHRFLLTKLRDGGVKAEMIESAEDPRLLSRMPFALIAVDRFEVAKEELDFDRTDVDLMKLATAIDGTVVDGVGVAAIMRPRIAKNLGGIDAFFLALTGINTDVVLNVEFEEDADGEGYFVWAAREQGGGI